MLVVRTVFVLGAELAAGAALLALVALLGRSTPGGRARAEASLGPLAVGCAGGVAAALTCGLALYRAGLAPGILDPPAGTVHHVAGSLLTAGAFLCLEAGRRQRIGEISRARALVRFGGLAMVPGALVQVVTSVLASPTTRMLVGTGAAVAAAVAGLLAALSGKPRPAGTLAAFLRVLGLLAMIVALEGRAVP